MAKTDKPMKNWFDSLTPEDIDQTEELVKDFITILRGRYPTLRAPAVILGLFALIHCYPNMKKEKMTIGDAFTDWLAFSKRKGIVVK